VIVVLATDDESVPFLLLPGAFLSNVPFLSLYNVRQTQEIDICDTPADQADHTTTHTHSQTAQNRKTPNGM
jgi:hypothetical protein